MCTWSYCNMPWRFVALFCAYVSTLLVLLFMEACPERSAPSESAQSGELWGSWRVVRGRSLRLIIRCFYGELPNFTRIPAKGENTRAAQAPSRQASLLHWSLLWSIIMISAFDGWDLTSTWWLEECEGERGEGAGDSGCWGEEDKREMNCSALLRAHTLPFSS